MPTVRLAAMILCAVSLGACDESTLKSTTQVALPASSAADVELVLAESTVIGPDGRSVGLAELVVLLPDATQKLALKVCKGTPHEVLTQALKSLKARQLAVVVSDADSTRCP